MTWNIAIAPYARMRDNYCITATIDRGGKVMYLSWYRGGVPPEKARTDEAPTGLIRVIGLNVGEDFVTVFYDLMETPEVTPLAINAGIRPFPE